MLGSGMGVQRRGQEGWGQRRKVQKGGVQKGGVQNVGGQKGGDFPSLCGSEPRTQFNDSMRRSPREKKNWSGTGGKKSEIFDSRTRGIWTMWEVVEGGGDPGENVRKGTFGSGRLGKDRQGEDELVEGEEGDQEREIQDRGILDRDLM